MAQYALGIKIVEFWPKAKDGVPGYAVKYEDGYISWSPKPIFERHYMPMGLDPSKVSEQMVDQMLYSASHQTLPTARHFSPQLNSPLASTSTRPALASILPTTTLR